MEELLSESDLALKIKKNCYLTGDEKNPKITADYFRQLGDSFKNKNEKLSLIQSAVLYNAALIRDPDNYETKRGLHGLCLKVLKLAEGKPDAELLINLNEEKCMIKDMRNSVEEKMQKVTPISNDVSEFQVEILEKKKISQIRKISDSLSDDFSSVMKTLFLKCLSLLKSPPCKFALVGLGSLARKEITPYSDFEHMILLEEGCGQESNLEYFRWLSVIFLIALVNLGETVVRFAAIPNLNDPLDSSKDWFYDNFTPCGISPDGFAPHACKNAFGRVTETELKPWKTELIQTVSKMLEYIETESDLKNGYFLADVLTTTCLVCGDLKLFELYQNGVKLHLQCLKKHKPELLMLSREIYQQFDILQLLFMVNETSYFDLKRVLYRALTLFISGLRKFNLIDKTGSFDAIVEMEKRNLIHKQDSHKLQYAVAVSCQMRLTNYLKQNGQSDMTYVTDLPNERGLVKAIGLKSIVDSLSIICALQFQFQQSTNVAGINFFSEDLTIKVLSCLGIRLYDEAERLLIIATNKGMVKNERLKMFFGFLCMGRHVKKDLFGARTYYMDALKHENLFQSQFSVLYLDPIYFNVEFKSFLKKASFLENLFAQEDSTVRKYRNQIGCLHSIAITFLINEDTSQNDVKQAVKFFKEAVEVWENHPIDLFSWYLDMVKGFFVLEDFTKAKLICEKAISMTPPTKRGNVIRLKVELASILFREESFKECLCKLQDIQLNTYVLIRNVNVKILIQYFSLIGSCHFELHNPELAIIYFETAARLGRNATFYSKEYFECVYQHGKCLLELDRSNEATQFLEDACAEIESKMHNNDLISMQKRFEILNNLKDKMSKP